MLAVSRKTALMLATLTCVEVFRPGTCRAEKGHIDLMRKTYAQISAILSVKDNALAPNENPLILAAPGILTDPKLDMTRAQDAATIINTLVDKVMELKHCRSFARVRRASV